MRLAQTHVWPLPRNLHRMAAVDWASNLNDWLDRCIELLTFDSFVNVCVVKDDEWRVTTRLERDPVIETSDADQSCQ